MKTEGKENQKQRCIIVGGAPINDYDRVKRFLSKHDGVNPHSNHCSSNPYLNHCSSDHHLNDDCSDLHSNADFDDYCIFCDSGMLHNLSLKMRVNLLVGDFDSYPENDNIFADTDINNDKDSDATIGEIEKIIRLPREKDDTDTAYAVKYALREGYRNFILIGCYGALADHSLANLGLLKYIKDCGGNAVLIDDYSIMEVLTGKNNIISNKYRYFSLLPIYGKAEGIDIENAKYNIKNSDVSIENPLTVSNETLDTDAVVSIECGALLIIKSDRH